MFGRIIVALLLSSSAKVHGAETFPKIKRLQGEVYSLKETLEVENKVPIKKEQSVKVSTKTRLKDRALLQVHSGAQMQIQLKAGAQMIIYPESVIEFPSIHWKQGVINEARIRQGKIRYLCEKECDLKISTALSEGVLPVGDYILTYDKKTPSVQLTVMAGEAVFRGLENENSLTLRAGERAEFTGIYTEDEVVGYDSLLKGRKVAQGKLGNLEKLSAAELLVFKKEVQEKQKKRISEDEIAKNIQKTALQICSSPPAKLNECSWTCEKNPKSSHKDCDYQKGASCIRKRCNANGQWADETILPINEAKCSAKIIVAPCDY